MAKLHFTKPPAWSGDPESRPASDEGALTPEVRPVEELPAGIDLLAEADLPEPEADLPLPAPAPLASLESGDAAPIFSRYLRELSRWPVLGPAEERAAMRRIEELELAAWRCLLGEPRFVAAVVGACERTLGVSATELQVLRRRAAAFVDDPSREAAAEVLAAADSASEVIHRLDRDRLALDAAHDEIRRLCDGAGPEVRARSRRAEQARARARRAKDDFVRRNLRLVISIARRYRATNLPFPDLVQEGNLGLLKAVDRFDHRRGHRFSTYATWWIRHAIGRALADKGRMVRLPVHLLDARQRVARQGQKLAVELGRTPSVEELSAATGIAPRKLESMRLVPAAPPLSLDQPVGDDEDDRRLIELVAEEHAPEHAADEALARRRACEQVMDLLDDLDPIERDIVHLRFGLDGSDGRTLQEIGTRYNLSRERIRQLEERALRKLRRALERSESGAAPRDDAG